MLKITTFAAYLVFLAGTFGASRITFFNTGVDQNGAPLQEGKMDAHYTLSFTDTLKYKDLTQPVNGQSAAVDAAAGWLGWRADNNGLSRWVSVPVTGIPAYAAPGFYQFRTTFTVTGADLSTFSLRGRWASDNAPVGVYLNGHQVGFQDSPGYADWTPLTLGPSRYFETNNTLDFVVQNTLTTSNPMGLRVELAEYVPGSATPWLLGGAVLLVGVAAVLLLVFRRRRARA